MHQCYLIITPTFTKLLLRFFRHVVECLTGDNTTAGCFSVFGAYLIHLTYGYLYSLRISFALFGLCMPVGGVLSCRIGYRPVVAVSCFLLSGGVLLTYFTIQKVYVGVLMTYSFLFGTGVGLGFSVTLAVAATWFPEQRGLVVGLVVSGYGMGSLVFGPIQTALINPHNVRVNNVTRQFDNKEMLDRLPDAFLILGGILLATQIIGFIFLRRKPKMEAVEEIKETASEKSSTKYETEDDLFSSPCGLMTTRYING
ncbi:unnamed protein product [Trichobilharzia szidati]|nr:unnamed protein product [Trichobilharzia szidati]